VAPPNAVLRISGISAVIIILKLLHEENVVREIKLNCSIKGDLMTAQIPEILNTAFGGATETTGELTVSMNGQHFLPLEPPLPPVRVELVEPPPPPEPET
jgi:hypothetical protein